MRTKVALIGSSGIVAQRLQQRLSNHPWFELSAVFGSPKQQGKQLSEIPWNLPEPRPRLPPLKVHSCEKSDLKFQLDKLNIQLVFSALPTDLALELEPFLKDLGKQVFSNSAAHRMSPDVPLIIPELNPDHIMLLGGSKSGFIICSTNCTVMPVAMSLKPIWDVYSFKSVKIETEQSLSGGGYELLNSHDNFSPEIPGEAEKISEECLRLLGTLESKVKPAHFVTQVICKRVMRNYGHVVKVKVDLEKEAAIEDIEDLISNFSSKPQELNLPSAPRCPLILSKSSIDFEDACRAGSESDNHDPGTNLKSGMAITVYNLKLIGSTLTFSAFSENTVRGAAGGCVLLAELAMQEGLLV